VPELPRVLELTSTFPRWENDTEPSFVYELSRRLVRAGFTVSVLAPHFTGAARHEQWSGMEIHRFRYFIESRQSLVNEGGTLSNLRRNKLNYLLLIPYCCSQLISLYRVVRKQRIQCIHAHWLIPQGLIAVIVARYLFRGRVSVLCTSHGSDLLGLNNRLFNFLKRRVIENSNHTTVVSRYMYEHCVSLGINTDNLSVQSMGVDLQHVFIPDMNAVQDIDILFVGRLVEGKGVEILLDAVHQLVGTNSRLRIVIAGDGPLMEPLTKQVKKLSLKHHIRFAGPVQQGQLPRLYQSARIVVVPSVVPEGLGLVLIEALGCGRPVVASALGAIRSVIRDGDNGLLARPGDARDLAEKIRNLLDDEDLYHTMASRSRASVLETYDWQPVTARYAQLIRSMARPES
jgi:glycosyltransferase involved in cell wall biosynthesis